MKLFNFLKKKNTSIPERKITVPDFSNHPFIKRCEYLKEEYGLIVPDVYKEFFTKYKVPETNFYYRVFWEERHDYLYEIIFYTKDFVNYIVKRFYETFGEEADYEWLQKIMEEGECEFMIKENKFEAKHIDLSFLDQCYEERGRNQEELMIVMDVYSDCGGAEYLILTSDKKGYSGGCYHGMSEKIVFNGAEIQYKILNHYRLVSELILKKHTM
ncbi:hypothetical protein [Chryseobacterium shigense]|uniref:SMI1 / KNR4 family (SUKH-1) n=1 Tax=Chryseobacterium shigense TaxID=297244 RepID=A0A841MWC0_9FLAO|nr:hypothetical protein [Chryseobacterium shigense]MBB6369256.1 hypothetical protein [Chryseobacterium shigense]